MSKRLAVAIAALVALAPLAACDAERADLGGVLAHAEGEMVDENGKATSLPDLLASVRGRPVSVSFAYVGCGGGRPRLAQLNRAAASVPDGDATLHLVLDIVDEPSRFPDLVRDLAGREETSLDPGKVRVAFLRKPDLFPKTNGEAVEGIMRDMGLRFGSQTHIETVSGIGMFDRDGRFLGIRY